MTCPTPSTSLHLCLHSNLRGVAHGSARFPQAQRSQETMGGWGVGWGFHSSAPALPDHPQGPGSVAVLGVKQRCKADLGPQIPHIFPAW